MQATVSILLGLVLSLPGCAGTTFVAPVASDPKTFTNPILDRGADPWVVYYKDTYYFMNTGGREIAIRKAADLADLRSSVKKVIWTPEPGKPWSVSLWAPELHRWGSKWYVYFAADAGKNETHRIYVLENSSDDPTQGTWTFKGKITDASDKWAIDASVFEFRGQHYMIWSGWAGDENGEQIIYLAHMSNPWTIDSARTAISRPTYDWEKIGEINGKKILVNEGPEALVHNGQLFVIYSASGCWTDSYCLGGVVAAANSNLLDPKSWKKIDHPLFSQDAKSDVYAPGHNGFFKSPDGKEDWIVYHANARPGAGCGGERTPRMQPFTWNRDGTPNFGVPVAAGKSLPKPSR